MKRIMQSFVLIVIILGVIGQFCDKPARWTETGQSLFGVNMMDVNNITRHGDVATYNTQYRLINSSVWELHKHEIDCKRKLIHMVGSSSKWDKISTVNEPGNVDFTEYSYACF
jgi:hypothetical protein